MTIRFIKNTGLSNQTNIEIINLTESDTVPHIGSDIIMNHIKYFVEDIIINYDCPQHVDVVVTKI